LENLTMHSTQNGNQPTVGADLIATRQSAPEDAPRPTGPGGTAVDIAYPPEPDRAEPDLAELSRQRRVARRIRERLISAAYRMKAKVKHADGGESTVTDIMEDEKALRKQIKKEVRRGSRKHRRAPEWMQWIPRYVLCFDFGILLYFFAGITNVNWASPVSMALGFALVLAAMVTVLSYGYLSFAGHCLRGFKNHEGTVHHRDLDGFTKVILGVAAAVIAVIATLMYLRMHTEVGYALGVSAGLTSIFIAAALAVVSVAANFLVVAIHALDGSDQVARLNRLSAAARGPYAKAQRLRERAAHDTDHDH
jgi:uncharacterized membrane protein